MKIKIAPSYTREAKVKKLDDKLQLTATCPECGKEHTRTIRADADCVGVLIMCCIDESIPAVERDPYAHELARPFWPQGKVKNERRRQLIATLDPDAVSQSTS